METHGQLNESQKIIVKVDAELAVLVPSFLQNRGTDIPVLDRALKNGDYETIAKIGHIMKGAGAGYGFDAVTEIGTLLEKAAKIKDAGEVQKQINELVFYLQHLEVVYE